MAGENKTYPSILGMVGLSLHLGNKDAAKDLKQRAQKAVDGGALEYSLVRESVYSITILLSTLVFTKQFLLRTATNQSCASLQIIFVSKQVICPASLRTNFKLHSFTLDYKYYVTVSDQAKILPVKT